jgi:hypothetical protein
MMSNPYSPSPADAKLARGSVVIESVEVKAASMLTIAGCLPAPCHQLRLQIPESPDT